MMSRFVIGLALALVLVAASPGSAVACLCGGTSEDSALRDARVAFVGVVARVDDPAGPMSLWASTGDPLLYTFAVEEVLKGELDHFVVIRSARDGSSCGLTMAIGERWRIFAHLWDGELWVGTCGASQRLASGIAVPPVLSPSGPDMWQVAGLIAVGFTAALWLRLRRRSPIPAA